MTRKSTQQTARSIDGQPLADWSRAYLATAAALGTAWCDFVGERFHAYAHVIDDVSHCHGLDEAWKLQATFGRETFKAYSEQTAKVSGLIMSAANGKGDGAKH
jgi:hypothetical protein